MARFANFTVNLNKVHTVNVSVAYATVDGTASAAAGDYTPASGTLIFLPGEISKTVSVSVRASDEDLPGGTFSLSISSPTNGTLGSKTSGVAVLPSGMDEDDLPGYRERFILVYDAVHDPVHQYFGPLTGPSARQRTLPRHTPGVDSNIINEAPDFGGETVSETASFWVGLEAWNIAMRGDVTGYNNCWDKIDQFYVPTSINQPMGTYNVDKPADYIPEGELPSMYPRPSEITAAVGVDPLQDELRQTYGTNRMYLMHWILDVEGGYGFKNGDGHTTNVYINTYQRGLQESSFETVTHCAWNDWLNGGGPYGFEPLFTQGKQSYPAAPFDYGKKWSYTAAPDAEVRAVQWAFFAERFAGEVGGNIAVSTARAKKMGDYIRYSLFDKYFREIGNNQVGAVFENEGSYKSCHFLINWYVAWGGEIPTGGAESSWSFIVACSECHQGYQAVDAAYFMAEGGPGFKPLSPSAPDIWLGSLYRQIEMIRWLQSPEGPIAGGVSNSWKAQYAPVTDGRETATFYGMVYTYSPVWHDPPSNNWVGFQGWGQGRTADTFLEVAEGLTPLALEIRPNLEIILNKLVVWFMNETTFTEDGGFLIPDTLSWVSPTQVVGQTTHTPNLEGVYEFKPSLDWHGQQEGYAAFWNESSVPNPTLHAEVIRWGTDLGVAASFAYLLLTFAQAKRLMGKFDSIIPNSSITARDAYIHARRLLDRSWQHWDGIGLSITEVRADYNRVYDEVYIPSIFSGTMPNGDVIQPGVRYIDIRTFLKDDPKWAEVQAYADGVGPAPTFRYHRFWAQAEYAISCAAMHRYFGDINETVPYTR